MTPCSVNVPKGLHVIRQVDQSNGMLASCLFLLAMLYRDEGHTSYKSSYRMWQMSAPIGTSSRQTGHGCRWQASKRTCCEIDQMLRARADVSVQAQRQTGATT